MEVRKTESAGTDVGRMSSVLSNKHTLVSPRSSVDKRERIVNYQLIHILGTRIAEVYI